MKGNADKSFLCGRVTQQRETCVTDGTVGLRRCTENVKSLQKCILPAFMPASLWDVTRASLSETSLERPAAGSLLTCCAADF